MPIEDNARIITCMEKAEIKRINNFLNDVHEGLCEGDEPATMPDKRDELLQELHAWRRSVNAPIPTKHNPDYTG